MAGTAVTNKFHFSAASLLIAPMAEQRAFNPLIHTLGLVKNVKVDAQASKVDLTQGVMNDIVATMTNGMPITGSGEVYEYTSKNFAYGLSLDPTGIVSMDAPVPITAPVAAAATTATMTAVPAGLAIGDWIYIQEGLDDQIHIARISAVTSTTATFAAYPVPTGLSFTTNARLGKVNKIDADPAKMNNNFAIRVVGIAVDGSTPIVLHFPKARITRGFSMGFSTDNFSNMPFEWTPMVPTPSDPGYHVDWPLKMNILAR